MPRVRFEPTISAGERPKTYALVLVYYILYYRKDMFEFINRLNFSLVQIAENFVHKLCNLMLRKM